MTSLVKESHNSTTIRLFLYLIVVGNIIILSIVFLCPRLVFMVEHWGASEREILLSDGPRDNPNMGHLRKIYKMMYFIKDHSEGNSTIYFINPQIFPNEVYKILLPRNIHFLDPKALKKFSITSQKGVGTSIYFVFMKKDKPEFCKKDEIIWDESGCGIYKLGDHRNSTKRRSYGKNH